MSARRAVAAIIRPARFFVSSSGRRWRAGAVAIVVLAAAFAVHADAAAAGRSLLRTDWHWMAVAAALMVVSLVLRSVALKVIVDAFGCVHARLGDAFSATSIGLLANAVIPIRAGTVITPYALYRLLRRRGARLPFATVLGMTLTEQLFAIVTFVVLSLLFVPALSLPAWAVQVLMASAALTATFLVGGFLLERRRRKVAATAGSRRDTTRTPDGAAGSARPARAQDGGPASAARHRGWRRHLPELADSQRIMGKPWAALAAAAVQTVAWLVQLGAAYAALEAFHLSGAGLRGAGLVVVLTNLVGMVPVTPGNVGTFQAAAVAALAVSGIAAGPAVAYALGLQGMQLAVAAVAGIVSLSSHGLSLTELRRTGAQATSLLYHGDQVAPVKAEEPAGL